MKVFFLLCENLAMDIEMARREIPAVRDGQAEICVVAWRGGVCADSVDKLRENYPCVSCVYLVNELRRGGGVAKWTSADLRRVCVADILQAGDQLFAHNTSSDGFELINAFLGPIRVGVLLTVR